MASVTSLSRARLIIVGCSGTAPLPRTPSCGELAWEPWLAGVAVRARVGLTVSGLKSDWSPRIGISGSAPAGVRAHERAVCRNSRPMAAAGGTLDLLSACRRTSVRPNENWPANWAFYIKPPTIGGPRVRNQSDLMQRHKATAATKKPANAGLLRAADGSRNPRPSAGKQNLRRRRLAGSSCK